MSTVKPRHTPCHGQMFTLLEGISHDNALWSTLFVIHSWRETFFFLLDVNWIKCHFYSKVQLLWVSFNRSVRCEEREREREREDNWQRRNEISFLLTLTILFTFCSFFFPFFYLSLLLVTFHVSPFSRLPLKLILVRKSILHLTSYILF